MKKISEMLRTLNGLDDWTTYDTVIPTITFSDGPTGLRHQSGECDHLGMNISMPATCFPTLSSMANTWNKDLVKEVAQAIAVEAKEQGVDVLLAPGVNMKRTPLCGRNFEYFSEDPVLAGELGIQYVNGLQENGIGTSLKHFAVNNQESFRLSIDANVDERALEEIYLAAFREIVLRAKPWTVMAAYNRINGTHCCENSWLLKDILRNSWGYDGAVISDWYAVNDIVKSIKNGLDLEMPGVGDFSYQRLMKAYKNKEISKQEVESAISHLKKLYDRCNNEEKKRLPKADYIQHHEIARKAAREAMVLLKNENAVLPLKDGEKIYFAGNRLESLNYQGCGSSKVNAFMVDSFTGQLTAKCESAKEADKIVFVTGLSQEEESEGIDRTSLSLPEKELKHIEQLLQLQKPFILVLNTGSVVTIPMAEQIDGILQAGFAGQGMGTALADVLYGRFNPSGHLSETYPLHIEDTPSYLFRGDEKSTAYSESVFIGYRYYDKVQREVLFPFGHGLSYSNVEYTEFKFEKQKDGLLISGQLENTSDRECSEVIQIYAGLNEDKEIQPVRQLRTFDKVTLAAGEKKKYTCTLSYDSFRYYHPGMHRWTYATGTNRIAVGKSSRNIVFEQKFELELSDYKYPTIDQNTTIQELEQIPEFVQFVKTIKAAAISAFMGADPTQELRDEMEINMRYTPLRNLCQISKGEVSDGQLNMLIGVMNTIVAYEGRGVKAQIAKKELAVIQKAIEKMVAKL